MITNPNISPRKNVQTVQGEIANSASRNDKLCKHFTDKMCDLVLRCTFFLFCNCDCHYHTYWHPLHFAKTPTK